MGSVALPGAVVLVNNDLSASVQNQLQIQLHIDETITGSEFDLRLAADPNYVQNIRAMQRRLLVMRDFRETANRTVFDVVIFIREALVYVEKNCFGPTGQTFYLAFLHWGQLGIYDTNLNRSCGCDTRITICGCGVCDGYGRAPYYPARFDPKYPQENHWYNQQRSFGVFGSQGCSQTPDRVLCRQYYCDAHGNVIPQIDCRLVKQ